MFVFRMLMLTLMRLCLCLCASENSIRQISGFVLLMFLLMLTLMSRVFSLVMLMLCLCASEDQPLVLTCSRVYNLKQSQMSYYIVSLSIYKLGVGKGHLFEGGAYFKFRPIVGGGGWAYSGAGGVR